MNGGKIAAGGTAGGGLGAALVYVLGRFGVDLNAEDGALIAAGLIAVGAFLVHNGLVGAWHLLLHGSPSPKAETGITMVETLVVLIIVAVFLIIWFKT